MLGMVLGATSQKTYAAPRFGVPGSFAVDGSPVRVVSGPIDREPGLDLVTGNEAGREGPSISLLLNRGNGSFSPEIRKNLDPFRYLLHQIAAADLNADGASDLAVGATNIGSPFFPPPTTLLVLLNDGSGTFDSSEEYELAGIFPQCLEIADIDGDGADDIALCHSPAGEGGAGLISILPGRTRNGIPDGSFGNAVDLRVGTSPTAVAFSDLDGDERSDAIVLDPDDGRIYALYGHEGEEWFDPPVVIGEVAQPSALTVADVDSDSLPEVVVANLGASRIEIYRQEATRTFGPPSVLAAPRLPIAVAVSQFDDSPFADIAVASLQEATVQIWTGNAEGSFVPLESVPVGTAPTSLAVADLNADGRPDLAVSSATTDMVTVVLNGADEPPTPTPTFTATATPSASHTLTRTRTLTPTPTATRTPTRTRSAAATRTPTVAPSGSPTATTPGTALQGDADCNGQIDEADVSAAARQLFVAPLERCPTAEANGDGRLSAADVLWIVRQVALGGQ